MVKVNRYKRWLVIGTLVLTLGFAAFLWLRPLLNIGSGYAAKHACSCHYLQGRELAEIRRNDLNFSVLGWVSLQPAERSVTASFFGLVPRTAHYREGRGCVLRNGPGPVFPVSAGGDAGAGSTARTVSTPLTDPGLVPEPVNDRLAAALDYGMEPVPGGGARGIVVLQNGRLLAERYADGYDATTPLLGWSMTKTLTGLAIGAYRGRDAGDPATATGLFPEVWTDRRADISLADLLHMNSGLAWNEAYGSLSDATIMLHEQPDMAAYAMQQPARYIPDSLWAYSSGTTNLLMEYLRRELGDNDRLYAFLYDSLFHRVAPSLRIEADQSGRPVGSSYGWATARDWARIGQLMLQDGIWRGDTLLPPGWVDYQRRPATGSGGNYGAQLWLPDSDVPALPPDAYLMRGFQDQRVFVIPGRNLVIARLGHGEDKVTDFNELLRRILTALPE